MSKPDIVNLVSINIAGSEIDYNTLDANFQKNLEIEFILSELESHIGRILKKLSEDEFNLSKAEWEHLLYYAAFLFCNSPNTRDKIERFESHFAGNIFELLSVNKSILENLLNRFHEENPHLPKVDVNNFAEELRLDSMKDIPLSKDFIVCRSLEMILPTYYILRRMHWEFHKLNDESLFITSDIPIIAVNKNQNLRFCIGFEHADLVLFPLTKKVCLVGNWLGPVSNRVVHGEFANTVNTLILKWCYNEVFSPLSLEELINQFKRFV